MASLRERNGFHNTTSENRSILGLPTPGNTFNGNQLSQQLLMKDNDQKIVELTQTVQKIKQISIDIEVGIEQSNKILDSLDSDMSGVQGLLSSSLQRLAKLTEQSGSRHMCYLILFCIFVFILLYFLMGGRTPVL